MSELNLEGEERDFFREHPQHKVYTKHCSTCFNEKCLDCNGIGEVSTMERVYSNEPHTAPVGSETCANCEGSGFELDKQIIEERYA